MLSELKISIYLKFMLTNSLTYSLMPSARHNSTMDVATGLISSLFDVALSRDVPFRQPQDVQCMHHGLAFVLPCVPVLFTDNARRWFVIARYGFLRQYMLSACIFCIKCILSFLYCSLFVTLCNRQSIAKNKAQWATSLSARNWLLGCTFRHEIICNAYLVPFCLLR